MSYRLFLFNNTIIVQVRYIIIVQVRYIIIETKEVVRIGYNGFLFPHSYSGDAPRPSPEYSCGKRNPLYPIRAASFVSIVLYLILISWEYLNLSMANEYVSEVTIPTQVIKYNQCCSSGSANQVAVFTSN